VNYDSKRGGISVMVERGPETTLSSLLIQKATRKGPFHFLKKIHFHYAPLQSHLRNSDLVLSIISA
jgi:hypothetical protein